jgi:Tfp pilus assembly protein PilF
MPNAATPTLSAKPAGSPWFHSARFDLLLLLLVPFLTWPLVSTAADRWGPQLLNQLILVSATGHYFATFVRAYGDRELRARFATRFWLAPALLLPTCVGFMVSGHGAALLLVIAGWAFWHWLAQAFGFARIYDRKCGASRPLGALLDKALVITGFVGAVVLNDGSLATFGKVVLDAGLGLPTQAQFAAVQAGVRVAMAVVGGAYLLHLGTNIVRRQPWSWQKQVMHATTIGYYWFAFAWLPNVPVAYVLYELFHDVQYYAITWLFGRQRVQRPGTAPWFQRLFRPGLPAAALFVGVMLACGAADFFGRGAASSTTLLNWSLGISATAALLHYYYDGFIWKAREQGLARDLGIQDAAAARTAPRLRHAAAWGLFAVPLLLVTMAGGPPPNAEQRAAALVALAPDDFLSRADLAFAQAARGELATAITNYRAAVAANPGYGQVRANFGATLEFEGDLDGAREQYEAALRCPDHESAHRMAHTNLGVLLLLKGDRTAAESHFRASQEQGGQPPVGRMLALANALPAARATQRQQLLAAVLQLDDNQPDARLALGQLALQQQRFPAAKEHFTVLLRTNANAAAGWVGLAAAEAGLGQLDQARAAVQQALQHEPGNAQALALRARLGG